MADQNFGMQSAAQIANAFGHQAGSPEYTRIYQILRRGSAADINNLLKEQMELHPIQNPALAEVVNSNISAYERKYGIKLPQVQAQQYNYNNVVDTQVSNPNIGLDKPASTLGNLYPNRTSFNSLLNEQQEILDNPYRDNNINGINLEPSNVLENLNFDNTSNNVSSPNITNPNQAFDLSNLSIGNDVYNDYAEQSGTYSRAVPESGFGLDLGKGAEFRDTLKTGSALLGSLSGAVQAYAGLRGISQAKKEFNFSKGLAETNLANQTALVNLQLRDRNRTERAKGITTQSDEDFVRSIGLRGIA